MDGTGVEASEVWKTYDGSHFVLQGVSARLRPGAVTMIQGPNGSGKTTLLNILGCLDRPSRGHVILHGTDVTTATASERSRMRRELVGMVFQEPRLMPDLTVRENLLLPLRIARVRHPQDRLMDLVNRLGLEGFVHRLPSQLSGGMAQRVAIARALANRPPILLADEPTASLDEPSTATVVGILRDAAGEGSTVVVASHDPRIQGEFERGLDLHPPVRASAR